MTDKESGFPDINFVDTDTETLVTSLIQSYEMFTGRTLYPADPTRLFILWIADIIIQERVIINESAKQNVPRYAQGKYLDSLAEIFRDTYRLGAKSAKSTFRFYLSKALTVPQMIPQNTRVTLDGKITFETTEDLYIKAGELYGDVAATCQTVGTIGNGFVPGQITQLVDVYPYYEKVENITTSAGGAEEETDEAFYKRMRESMETFSTAGPIGAYEYHAKSASTIIADVKATSPTPGVVDVRVLLQGGKLPDTEILNEVANVLKADDVRPLTDNVKVAAPEAVPYSIDFTYYMWERGENSAEVIAEEVNAAVNKYKQWQSTKMGRDINPSYLISMVMATGVKRVDIRSPFFTTLADNAVAVAEKTIIVNGGIENE
ncbi:phage-related baseplate assembly protein [Hydrogenoanaerobacterium saccharovorans]|uniref:Phage-related baseplate assembly protein n=1 Tax=Hydrogenoanaerobacterium saccharovorans TaxID=474960 RepID=A0A1H7ZZU6_9FIRM|nr:baseplate J/gp47 family protein [Hydrogenoanaerobacterium saccharovorans]RPF48268.1 phage-related baseplate assembly protein [Hydrogenoanaerobacterium saccharovorans]SEM63756.1 Phage-related baseplate assembly protein [Hydrogenoanaerobacterium saccharovorans]